MRKTLTTVSLLTLLRFVSGCIGPHSTDDNLNCVPVTNSRVLDPEERQGILEVLQGVDSAGRPYQTANLVLATPRAPSDSVMVLNLNGERQGTAVWNGRLVGLGRPVDLTGTTPEFGCDSTAYWSVPVGFGTIAEGGGSADPSFSLVGHPLREGQEIQVRVDLCQGSICVQGTPRTFRVRIRS